MRSSLASILLAGALALGSGLPLRADHETTAADIIRMRKGGLRDETILAFIRTYQARVLLTGRGVADLAEAGFREEFIQALLLYVKSQPLEETSRPREEGDYPPSDPPAYATTFYVGYAYDAWAFPWWYYGGHYDGGHYLYGHHGHQGWGRSSHGGRGLGHTSSGARGWGHSTGGGHSRGLGGGHGGGRGGGGHGHH